jgi:hypothetical protein
MSGVPHAAKFFSFDIVYWQTRNDGDPVVALLAMNCDVLIAKLAKVRTWKFDIATFCFLKAKQIWLALFQKIYNERETQTDGIYVPGSDLQFHDHSSHGAKLAIFEAIEHGFGGGGKLKTSP